jgi:hypothetical protein
MQQQTVITSIRRAFPAAFPARLAPDVEPIDRALIAELVALDGTDAVADASFERKQPDWTHDATDSGQAPVERLTDHRAS